MRPFATLASRLVVTAVALVAVVCLLIGTVTTLAMHESLMDRLDADVRSLVSGSRPGGPPGSRNGAPGTLWLAVRGGAEPQGGVLGAEHGDYDRLDDVDDLVDVPVDDALHTVDVAGHGDYRVIAVHATDRDTGESVRLVTGLPTDDVDDTIRGLVTWEAVLTLLGVLAATLAGTVVVRRQLRPLREVAATAHAVSALPLASGDVGITERVPDRLTDERTEAGQVGAALNRLLDHVESSLSARHRSEQQVRQFVADASHELRTPLTTIGGYTELARRQDTPETSSLALAKVEEEAARMTTLVEDLLLLARLDAGRPLAAEDVDLTRLLLEAVDDARVVAPDHRWQVVLPADGRPVEVTGDERGLHQVVTNLLANARKYTPPGTTVTVTVRADGFDVHDDGPGFPPELVGSAFERFTRGDAARQRSDGVGLGLALVQAIVAAHGGRVGLRSVPGDTRIRVDLGRPQPRERQWRPAAESVTLRE